MKPTERRVRLELLTLPPDVKETLSGEIDKPAVIRYFQAWANWHRYAAESCTQLGFPEDAEIHQEHAFLADLMADAIA